MPRSSRSPTLGDVEDVTQLAIDAQRGDRRALEDFVRITQGDVWRLHAHLMSPAEADDLTQDTYVRALAALPRFRGESSARTWLLTIARRTAVDAIRSAVRRRRLPLARPVTEPDPAGRVALEMLVAGLDPDRREAFVLTQVLGLPYAEAAVVARCPVGTIRSRVARARDDMIAATTSGQVAGDDTSR